jgi:Uma2 family endonuclease
MGTVILERSVSEEEYLKNPAFEHHEYVDGAVVERYLGTFDHGTLQGLLFLKLREWKNKHRPTATVSVQLHCKLTIQGRPRYRLPDVALVLRSRAGRYLEGAPELVVEIFSPEDSLPVLFDKFEEYFDQGCQLGWIAFPEEKEIWAITPDQRIRRFRRSELLTGFDLLPGFETPVDFYFDEL